MINAPLYIAVDQGGQSTRALVFDEHGALQVEARQEVSVRQPASGFVEQDAEELTNSVSAVLQQVTERLGEDLHRVQAMGLATQRSNVVCWDRENGRALSPAISWQDCRASAWIQNFMGHQAEVHRRTGLLISAHYGASKLKWCFDQLAAVQQAHKEGRLAWGPLASFLTFRLLEQPSNMVDPANAARTLLWNLLTRDWDDYLLNMFGIAREPLPQCVPSIHRYGDVKLGICRVPLKVVTGDQSAVIYAFAKPDSATAYANLGTGAFLQVPTGDSLQHVRGLLSGVVLDDGEHSEYVLEGTVNGAACALTEIETALAVPVDAAQAQYAQWLAQSTNPPVFLNGVAGLGSPYWVPEFESRFIGDAQPWEKLVAVGESIVFLLWVNLQRIQQHGIRVQRILVTGGLAAYDGLCERLANLSNIAVYRPAESEATARGIAYLTANRPAVWHESESGQWFQPRPDTRLTEHFHCWEQAMDAALQNYRPLVLD